jgi:SNF2 family DNA or RNA helicase
VNEDEEVNKQFIIFDRNDSRYKDGTGQQLLVKWVGLTHTEATYEYERDLILMEIEYESHLAAFRNRTKKPDTETIRKNVLKYERVSHHVRRLFKRGYNNQMKNEGMESYARELDNEVFKNGGKLRDYQADGVSWLIANYVAQRSCILADVSTK